ncbi:MAG: sigma-70 family RNA polymerase sigma factor [Planctomycetaceae bacterium]|nr:sigma-70 family RNA polymerase sigma factor [Planctomycetaceae bacterium]
MPELTRLLNSLANNHAESAPALVDALFQELHQMAREKLRQERWNCVQATELVNEVYLRICANQENEWQNRAHFFAAAAEAMRRILIDAARRRNSQKRGGEWQQADLPIELFAIEGSAEELLVINDLLDKLQSQDPAAAQLVKLRVFAGFKMSEIADILGVSPRTAQDLWSYGKAWLHDRMKAT